MHSDTAFFYSFVFYLFFFFPYVLRIFLKPKIDKTRALFTKKNKNSEFFKLMRQVEIECNEMSWTKGPSNTTGGGGSVAALGDFSKEIAHLSKPFDGGTFRLGGISETALQQQQHVPARVLAANAAELRLTMEDEEVLNNCGCGHHGIYQRLRPTSCATNDKFQKKEDVLYKDGSSWVNARITGVHLDDGPDNPYYTITFMRGDNNIEKQTTEERLRRREQD